MRKFLLLLILLSPIYICQGQANVLTEEALVKRVHAHLVLRDKEEAYLEAQAGIKQYPESPQLYKAYIQALAEMGKEKEMLDAWKTYKTLSNEQDCRSLLETMAWGIIEKGSQSSSPAIRVMAVLAAFLSQDARGVTLMSNHLTDSNAFIRKATVELSGQLRDRLLCTKVLQAFHQEKNVGVHEEILSSIGSMKIGEAAPILTQVLQSEQSSFEEKKVAIVALVNMTESITHEHLQHLIHSPRVGLRLLACELVCHLKLEEEVESLFVLSKDSHAQVRAAALQVFGMFGRGSKLSEKVLEIALNLTNDRDPHVQIPAAWVLTLMGHIEADQAFKKVLGHTDPKIRIAAAGALTSTGKYGVPLLQQVHKESKDPFVKLNAALGLISQQTEIPKACETLYEGLEKNPQKWMWEEFGIFRAVAPSTIAHDEAIPHYPESVDQATRLQILNTLAIMQSEHAQEAIKHFLKEKGWGISGMASILLLSEGDDAALTIIENLIDDPDPQIKIQAALVLALWGGGEKAILTLQEAYDGAPRDVKEKILEGLGRVASATSIPFLIDKLGEPFQILRIIAASSLLMCLNH